MSVVDAETFCLPDSNEFTGTFDSILVSAIMTQSDAPSTEPSIDPTSVLDYPAAIYFH